MRILADTHLLLWAAAGSDRLSARARSLLLDPDNDLSFSAASLWEVQIKASLGRADFRVDVALLRHGLLANGYEEVPVRGDHAIALVHLPLLHRDPFDRILVCQARVEGLTLLTSDDEVAAYGTPVLRV